MLGSSLAIKSIEEASLQQGWAASLENEVSRLQMLTGDLEQQLAEARARDQQAGAELTKMKEEKDNLANKLVKSRVLVVELREAVTWAKTSVVESSNFRWIF